MATQGIAKKTKGRQKIEMKKIENGEDKLITFSKRRTGIYKKISELAILTGAKIGFVVYSPARKSFSFWHPSVEAIVNIFIDREEDQASNNLTNSLVEAHRQLRIDELTTRYNELVENVDEVKEKDKKLKEKMREVERNGWWDAPIEEFNAQHLSQLLDACNSFCMTLSSSVTQMAGQYASVSSSGQSRPHHEASIFDQFVIDQNEPPRSLHSNGKRPRLM